MGQHIVTAFAQIVSEELELDWNIVNIDYPGYPDNLSKLGVHFTAASRSVTEHFDDLSRAGVAGRIALIEVGAELMGVNAEDCIAKNSAVIDQWSGQTISYSQILSQTTIERKFSSEELLTLKPKDSEEYKLIGKPLQALDNFSKIDGSAIFGIDSYLPNMIYAAVVPPPTRKGSVITSYDDANCQNIKGYIKAINPELDKNDPLSGWMIVTAQTFPAAMRAAKSITIKWDVPQENRVNTSDLLNQAQNIMSKKNKGAVSYHEGDIDKGMSLSDETHQSIYTTSFVAHALLEPWNAVVGKINDTWHVISGQQANSFTGWGLTPEIANLTNIKEEEVKLVVHQRYAGGGFGSRDDVAARLAIFASVNLNKSVKLIFTREAMMKCTEPRTATYQRLTAGISQEGILENMHVELCAGSMLKRPEWGIPADWFQEDIENKGLKIDKWTVDGGDHWYSIRNRKYTIYENDKLNSVVPVGALRSIANGYMVFTVESFIDEIAHKLGRDPVEFRLSMLNNESNQISTKLPHLSNNLLQDGRKSLRSKLSGGALRLRNALLVASGKAGYSLKEEKENYGIGVAVSGSESRDSPTWSACVAEIRIDLETGMVDVEKLTYAIDCGTVINRDGALAQIEGAALFGVSLALHEELTLEDGQFNQNNFDTYKWMRLKNAPKVDIELIETGGHPVGLGEPATTVVAPAIANAIFNGTGIRIKKLPIKPSDIRKALQAS